MRNLYSLRIEVSDNYILLVDQIIGIEHTRTDFGWEMEIEEVEESINYINFFLDILDGKYEILEKLGATRDMISIWHYYEYDWQCNFEYSPLDLKRLGDNGITLCVSCWDSGEEPEVYDENEDKILN